MNNAGQSANDIRSGDRGELRHFIYALGVWMPLELIDQADKALYAARKDGRNCVMTLDPLIAVANAPDQCEPRVRRITPRASSSSASRYRRFNLVPAWFPQVYVQMVKLADKALVFLNAAFARNLRFLDREEEIIYRWRRYRYVRA
jgi:hypothetical protein